MKEKFITIVGQNHYFGMKPFKIGQVVKLVKEPDNSCDYEAIKVTLPYIGTVGYVANSSSTVYQGTHSAGRLYDKIGNVAYAKVMFVTHSSVIALVGAGTKDEYKKFEDPDDIVHF